MMAGKKPDISRKQATTQIDESDDFVLPIAPPSAPPPLSAASTTASATVSSTEPSSLENRPPSLPINIGVAATDSSPSHGTTESEDVEDSDHCSDTSASRSIDQPASSSLVAGLVCAVVVLLFIVIIQFNHSPEHVLTPVGLSPEYEGELRRARAETEASRREIAQMEEKVGDLEEQLVASRSKAEGQVANLLEDNKKLKSQSTELSSEISRLAELHTTTSPTTASESPSPAQKTPVVQQEGQAYRVAGLRPGDTLNVRSGPGVSYTVVTALQNDVKVTVTGAAVMNGPDAWLPCIIALNGVDPATDHNRSWNQKCWINSFFIEQIENQ